MFLTTGIATIIIYKAFGKNLQNEDFLSSLVAHGLLFSSFSNWPTGFYSEENCQTIAHGPLVGKPWQVLCMS